MPIRKLWNALRGQSDNQSGEVASQDSTSQAGQPRAEQAPRNLQPKAASSPAGKPAPKVTPAAPAKARPAQKPAPQVAAKAAPAKVESNVKRGIFGGAQLTPEQKSVVKLIKASAATSVLEIGVGDGSRAGIVLETLQKSSPDAELRYLAIDEFEMGDGPITMRDFNQSLRSQNVRPQIFPEPLGRGMTRVAHTFGAVDLILIGASPEQWASADCESLLTKIAHTETVVLQKVDDTWRAKKVESAQIPASSVTRRKAA